MDTKKFVFGTIGGCIAGLIGGYLFYGMLLSGFFEANAGTATNAAKGIAEIDWLWMVIGHLFFGALYSYVFLKWAGIKTFAGGVKGGAVLTFLIAGAYALIYYATTNISNLTASLVDIIVSTVIGAFVGGVVGVILGSGSD